jgi:hypothetical protein
MVTAFLAGGQARLHALGQQEGNQTRGVEPGPTAQDEELGAGHHRIPARAQAKERFINQRDLAKIGSQARDDDITGPHPTLHTSHARRRHRIVSKHHEALVGVRGVENKNRARPTPRPCRDILRDDLHGVGQAASRDDLNPPAGIEALRRQHQAVAQVSHAA